MNQVSLKLLLTLDQFQPVLEATAADARVTLDFLMRQWNGRFATYNVGRPVAHVEDSRRGVRDEARHYRLIGRLKATSQPGVLHILLLPPSACDLNPTRDEETLWQGFVDLLVARLGRSGQVVE